MIPNPKMTTISDLLAQNLLTAMLGKPATDDDVPVATDDPASFAAMLQCLLPPGTAVTTATTETTATKATAETTETAVAAVAAVTTATANGNAGWKPALPGTAVAAATVAEIASPQVALTPVVPDATPQVHPPSATQTATDNVPPQVAATQAVVADRTVAPETLASPAIVAQPTVTTQQVVAESAVAPEALTSPAVAAQPTLVSEPLQPTVMLQSSVTDASPPETVPQETVAPRQPVARGPQTQANSQTAAPQAVVAESVVAPEVFATPAVVAQPQVTTGQVVGTQAAVAESVVAPEVFATPAVAAQPRATTQEVVTTQAVVAVVTDRTVAPETVASPAIVPPQTTATPVVRKANLQIGRSFAAEPTIVAQPTRPDGTPQPMQQAAVRIPVRPDEQAIDQQRVAVSIVRNGPAASRTQRPNQVALTPASATDGQWPVIEAVVPELRTRVEPQARLRVASVPVANDSRAPVVSRENQQAQTPTAIAPWAGVVQAATPSVAQADPTVVIHEVRLPEVEVAQMREGEPQRLRVQLDPPHLGECEIELTLRHGTVHAMMLVERADTAVALRHVEPQIRQALAERGLELASFDVGQGPADSSARQGEGAQPAWDRTGPALDTTDEQTAETAPTRVVSRQHSGRIDLVA